MSDLTKLTVNLLPRSYAALTDAAERVGDTRTDTVNRAIQLYDQITDMRPGWRLTFTGQAAERITLMRVRGMHPALRATLALLPVLLAFIAGVAVAS